MAQAKLSLSWDSHQKNICSGLSQLQQRGEFVDMTLAADGHHVKVHQMVMALNSAYIKELISSASCPHPVIFLNNISHKTLCAMLEYVYMGEVLVSSNELADLIAAGKALQIKGLKDMNQLDAEQSFQNIDCQQESQNSLLLEKLKECKQKRNYDANESSPPVMPVCKIFVGEGEQEPEVIMEECDWDNDTKGKNQDIQKAKQIMKSTDIQYTISNQGGLQIIHNRFIYHLRYIQKNRDRLWRCIDYSSPAKCPAKVFSNEKNQVIKRSSCHNHPFHDAKILKKIRLGTIYTAFQVAESMAEAKKQERSIPCSPAPNETQ